MPPVTPRIIAVLVVAAGVAFISGSHSVAQILQRPTVGLGPIGQHSNGLLAEVIRKMPKPDKIGNPAAAMRSIHRTMTFAPLNAGAPRMAGLVLNQAGKTKAAHDAMAAAVKLTRRDGTAQFWLANEAIAQRDLPQVLYRFDLIMRTHPAASPPMYETLARTLVDPIMRKEMQRFVSLKTPWLESFSSAAAAKPVNAEPLARLFLASKTVPDSPAMRNVYAAVLSQLGADRKYGLIQSLYPRLPGASEKALKNIELPSDDATEYPPVSWARASDGSFGSAIVGRGADRLMELYVSSGAGGVAARKFLILNPGNYSFRWRSIEGPTDQDAQARALISCAAKGTETIIAESDIKPALDRGGSEPDPVSGELRFTVPSTNCAAILVDFRVGSGNGREEARWLFDRLSLVPVAKAAAVTSTPAS